MSRCYECVQWEAEAVAAWNLVDALKQELRSYYKMASEGVWVPSAEYAKMEADLRVRNTRLHEARACEACQFHNAHQRTREYPVADWCRKHNGHCAVFGHTCGVWEQRV